MISLCSSPIMGRMMGAMTLTTALSIGCAGADGRDGIAGMDGRDGIDGRDGAPGRDGLNGQDGRNGIDGMNGLDGLNGRDGAPGRDGIDGLNGRDGIDGMDGRDGGRGPAGPAGEAGPQGPTGDTGPMGPQGEIGPPYDWSACRDFFSIDMATGSYVSHVNCNLGEFRKEGGCIVESLGSSGLKKVIDIPTEFLSEDDLPNGFAIPQVDGGLTAGATGYTCGGILEDPTETIWIKSILVCCPIP